MFLLAASMMSAFADPGKDREAARAERRQQWAQAFEARRGGGQLQRQADLRRAGDERQPERSQPIQQGGPPGNGSAAQDVPRRNGRMTLEERRALRQQINEAGRDIYTPNR